MLTTQDHYISGSVCKQCHQVIPTETKLKQIDELLFKTYLADLKSGLSNSK
ncbi:hypothetical protein [Aquirhabdus sp.]|uniref:hypothetical protein n=1 Tax=Aquirhabdus sp. TaxID=2824160 RepID=UPI00396C6FA8